MTLSIDRLISLNQGIFLRPNKQKQANLLALILLLRQRERALPIKYTYQPYKDLLDQNAKCYL